MNLKTLINETKKLNEEYNNKLADLSKSIVEELANTGISTIYIYGYTPGFNDGDPCEHTTDFYVNVERVWLNELDGVRMINRYALPKGVSLDDDDCDNEEEAQKIVESAGVQWQDPRDGDVNWAIGNVLIPMLDKEFETDYQVLFVIKDGKVERYHEDYNCGY